MALHRDGKNGNNNPHFSDFLKLKITICISYKCKHVKVPNLVYFGSPSTVLSKVQFAWPKIHACIFTGMQIILIGLNLPLSKFKLRSHGFYYQGYFSNEIYHF